MGISKGALLAWARAVVCLALTHATFFPIYLYLYLPIYLYLSIYLSLSQSIYLSFLAEQGTAASGQSTQFSS
jgi:type IV secretory pathway TrbL component